MMSIGKFTEQDHAHTHQQNHLHRYIAIDFLLWYCLALFFRSTIWYFLILLSTISSVCLFVSRWEPQSIFKGLRNRKRKKAITIAKLVVIVPCVAGVRER